MLMKRNLPLLLFLLLLLVLAAILLSEPMTYARPDSGVVW